MSWLGKLFPEQDALISIYEKKWEQIAFLTEPIDRPRAAEAVKAAYAWINKLEPEILFADSPYAAVFTAEKAYESRINTHGNSIERTLLLEKSDMRQPMRRRSSGLGELFNRQLRTQLYKRNPHQNSLFNDLTSYFDHLPWVIARHNINFSISQHIHISQRQERRRVGVDDLIDSLEPFDNSHSWLDFCISVLDCSCDRNLWEILQTLVTSCGWILPLEGVCIICDRFSRISFDSQNRLHAEGHLAIQFRDGFGIYAYDGEAIGFVTKAPETQEPDEEQPSVNISSLLSQLTFLMRDFGDNSLSFIHWTHHPDSRRYVLHSQTILQDIRISEFQDDVMPLVVFQNSLFIGYEEQASYDSNLKKKWTIARLDSIPILGQEAVAPTLKKTFKSLGAIATDGNYLWAGAEAALMLLDRNLETLDQVSLDVDKSFYPNKNAHDILIYQNTAYLLDNIVVPILLFQVKVDSTPKLELLRVLEVQGVYIHLEHQWLNPDLNQWVVIESSGGRGRSQKARIFPMHLLAEAEESLETIGSIQVLARTEKSPFWAVIHDPAAGFFLTSFQDLETGTEVGERRPLELKADFKGRYRVHLEQRDEVLLISTFKGSEYLHYQVFWVKLNNSQINKPIERIDSHLVNLKDCLTQLGNQQLFINYPPQGDRDGRIEGFCVIAATHCPPSWAVIYESESKDYFLAALDTKNNQVTVGSKLSLGWGTSHNLFKIIFKQKDHFLIILERTHNLLTIVDIQKFPKIIHRQILNDHRLKVEDLLIQNMAE